MKDNYSFMMAARIIQRQAFLGALLGMLAAAYIALAQSPTPSSAKKLSPAELKIWKTPKFQRQFIESYKAETEIEPRVTTTERETMQKVLNLISSDQRDAAAELLQDQRGKEANAVFDFTQANIYFQREAFDQAAAAYRAAVDKFPKFRRAWKNLGIIYVRQKQFDKAIPALTRVIELGGNDAITYGLLGYAYSSTQNFLPAESAFRQAILLDAKTLDWKMGLARSFFKQERYAEAAALSGKLVEQYPQRGDLWLLQANAFIGLGRPLDAAENYELLDRMGQATTDSLFMLGDIYINEKLYGLAVDAYIRAIEKDSKQPPDRAVRSAKILVTRGAYEATEVLIRRIERAYAEQLSAEVQKDLLKLQSRIAVAQGAAEQEVKVLKEIVELDPLDGEALILLGRYYERQGDDEQAVFYYEQAANIEGFEAEAKLRHAQLFVRDGRYASALPLLRRAQQIDPRENVQKYLDQVERLAKGR